MQMTDGIEMDGRAILSFFFSFKTIKWIEAFNDVEIFSISVHLMKK